MTIIVAFTGKRGSGKSAAAQALCEKLGFVDLKFADPLKNMLRALYHTCGVAAETIERKLEGDLKEMPCEWLRGSTPRYAMQTLGTEWRDMISTDLWSEMFKMRVHSGEFGGRVTCSDYRFPHEGLALRQLNALIVRVTRDESYYEDDEASKHASETMIDNIPYDWTLRNVGELEDLQFSVVHLVEEFIREKTNNFVTGRTRHDVQNGAPHKDRR